MRPAGQHRSTMIQVHCSTIEEIDAVWQGLLHAPEGTLLPCDIYLNGTFRYRVIRHDGEQTTAPPADPPA